MYKVSYSAVDLDGSGTIEFNEFLEIMSSIKRGKSADANKNSPIFDFFKSILEAIQNSVQVISDRSSTSR